MALVEAIPIILVSLKEALADIINEFTRRFTGPLLEKFDEMWDEVKQIFSDAWEVISGAASDAWETISGIWENVSTWFDENVVQPIGGFFSDIWDALKTGASDAWEGIKTVFSVIPKWFSNVFTDAWSGVKKVFETGGSLFPEDDHH
jgi:phage-related protein